MVGYCFKMNNTSYPCRLQYRKQTATVMTNSSEQIGRSSKNIMQKYMKFQEFQACEMKNIFYRGKITIIYFINRISFEQVHVIANGDDVSSNSRK